MIKSHNGFHFYASGDGSLSVCHTDDGRTASGRVVTLEDVKALLEVDPKPNYVIVNSGHTYHLTQPYLVTQHGDVKLYTIFNGVTYRIIKSPDEYGLDSIAICDGTTKWVGFTRNLSVHASMRFFLKNQNAVEAAMVEQGVVIDQPVQHVVDMLLHDKVRLYAHLGRYAVKVG